MTRPLLMSVTARRRHHARLALAFASLAAVMAPGPARAQPEAAVQPLRTAPTEAMSIKTGVRDYGPATLVGGTLYVGNPTGGGALFAMDPVRGRLKWTYVVPGRSSSVSTPPVVVGDRVIAPFGAANPGAVVAVSTASGKELWRSIDPSAHSAVVAEGERVFVVSKNCTLYALAAATGKELWKTPLRFVPGGACTTSPVVRDGRVYAVIMARAPEGTPGWPDARYLAAFDAATGQERWRHRPLHPEYRQGAAPRHPVVTERAVYFAGENALYALDRATGQPLFAPVFLERIVDGRKRPVDLDGLIDAGATVVGGTEVSLVAFDKTSGRIAWEIPGRFQLDRLALAVAGPVLYFQGGLDGANGATKATGTLHALDMTSGTRLWSYTRPATAPSWSFHFLLPIDGALWADTHSAMIKLQ